MSGKAGRPLEPFVLSEEERDYLVRQARGRRAERALSERCRMILRCADGLTNKGAAAKCDVQDQAAGKWRRRFVKCHIAGLSDVQRPGRPRRVTDAKVTEVLERTLDTVPDGVTSWPMREMAEKSGVSPTTVWRIWKAFGLQPHSSETFKLSSGPRFAKRFASTLSDSALRRRTEP